LLEVHRLEDRGLEPACEPSPCVCAKLSSPKEPNYFGEEGSVTERRQALKQINISKTCASQDSSKKFLLIIPEKPEFAKKKSIYEE